MKNNYLSIGLLILGTLILLFSVRGCVGGYITTKEQSCSIIKQEIASGKYASTIDIEKEYLKRQTKGFRSALIQMGVGLFLFVLGLILYYSKNNIFGSWKAISVEILVNFTYWVFFISLIGYVFSGGGQMFVSCTIDWIYIFLTAAMAGFYLSYIVIYKKFDKRVRKQAAFWGYVFLFSAIGAAISYLPIALYSSVKYNMYKPLFSIMMFLALGLFSFISFVHVFVGLFIRKVIEKQIIKNQCPTIRS